MIRILMLDLGETLVHDEKLFPHVADALAALVKFETADGKPLGLSLVSDFTMPRPPSTKQKIDSIFRDYAALLNRLGLTRFFEPLKEHVTLSTHAGVFKPDRRIFELAVNRLGVTATLAECLFITEDTGHLVACRKLGMSTLQFSGTGAPGSDFSDWAKAPLIIANTVAPKSPIDRQLGVKVQLSAEHAVEMISFEDDVRGSRRLRGRAHKWHPVTDPASGEAKPLLVPLPVDVEVSLDDRGRVESYHESEPNPADVEEAASFVETLEANGQLSRDTGPLPPDATHQIETDEEGRNRLVRKRFSAI